MSEIEISQGFVEAVTAGNVSEESLDELRSYFVAHMDADATTVSEIEVPEVAPEAAEYRVELGKHVLPNEVRIHKHGPFNWPVETRQHSIKAWLTLKHPDLSDFLSDALACAGTAATGAVLAGIFASPAAGYALFYPVFKTCLVVAVGETIASEVEVEIDTEDFHGPWSGH